MSDDQSSIQISPNSKGRKMNTCLRRVLLTGRSGFIPGTRSGLFFRNQNLERQNSGWKNESFFEPAYLDQGGPEIPLYDLVNVQVKGYDYPVLESYGKFVHKSAERFKLDVEDAWGTPCKVLKVTKLKPESVVVDSEFQLNIYERNVQLADVPSITLPVFINFIEAALPAGVTLNVHPHQPEFTENRYIPDYKLEELKEELNAIKSGKEKK